MKNRKMSLKTTHRLWITRVAPKKKSREAQIAQPYYIAWCHIKSEHHDFAALVGCLKKSNVSCSFLYLLWRISALGMGMFGRWIVRSDPGYLGLCDVSGATSLATVPHYPHTVHSSLLPSGASFSLFTFAPHQIHIRTTRPN